MPDPDEGSIPSGGGTSEDVPIPDTTGSGETPTSDSTTEDSPASESATRVVTASDGDTLCSIGSENGFRNCQKLRDPNPDLQNRPLRPGDQVNVPEVTRKDEDGETERVHEFRRLGQPPRRIWIIQDRDKPSPEEAVSDEQDELCVSNYVPTRQGAVLAPDPWVDHTVTDYNEGASVDPDHFKILVRDPRAQAEGEDTVEATLQAQKPVLNNDDQIESWEDMTETGTELEHIECKQIGDTAFYKSCYLRLVTDERDHTFNRPDGRRTSTLGGSPPPTVGTNDTGTDVSRQTLVTPTTDDDRIEILDLRVNADRPNPDCPITDENAKCRSQTTAEVGKEEKVLRVKTFRINGCGVSEADIDTMIANMRKTLAQINAGVETVDGKFHDVPPPRNMIAVSDYWGNKASGGRNMSATVSLTSGRVTATVETTRKHTPEQTARRLAAALTGQGVTCRVSRNPPQQDSGDNFGSCDILCFNSDDTPARIIDVDSDDSDQALDHTGGWDVNSVNSVSEEYNSGGRQPMNAFMAGSKDYRAAVKNFHRANDHVCAILIGRFAGGHLGEAVIPFHNLNARLRPVPDYSLSAFIARSAVATENVTAHEFGHVLLDASHTTNHGSAPLEPDHDGATYCDNAHLAYSALMGAYNWEPNHIHKRISDVPLRVKYMTIKRNTRRLEWDHETWGAGNPTPAARYRDITSSVFSNLRTLESAPGSNL